MSPTFSIAGHTQSQQPKPTKVAEEETIVIVTQPGLTCLHAQIHVAQNTCCLKQSQFGCSSDLGVTRPRHPRMLSRPHSRCQTASGRASQLHRCSAADGRQRQLCTAELRQLIMDGVGVLPLHLEPTCSRGLGVLLQQLNKKWLVQLVNSVCSTCHNIWNHYAVEA